MFGFSLSKIIFTILVIVAVWKGWRLMEAIRNKISDPDDYVRAPKPRRSKTPKAAETLYECPHCQTYVPNGTICRSKEHCVLRQG